MTIVVVFAKIIQNFTFTRHLWLKSVNAAKKILVSLNFSETSEITYKYKQFEIISVMGACSVLQESVFRKKLL